MVLWLCLVAIIREICQSKNVGTKESTYYGPCSGWRGEWRMLGERTDLLVYVASIVIVLQCDGWSLPYFSCPYYTVIWRHSDSGAASTSSWTFFISKQPGKKWQSSNTWHRKDTQHLVIPLPFVAQCNNMAFPLQRILSICWPQEKKLWCIHKATG